MVSLFPRYGYEVDGPVSSSLARATTNSMDSRNCTKHNCRCDYMDSPPAEEPPKSPKGPNLLWTPRIEHEVEVWQRTGVFPFFDLNLQSSGHFIGLTSIDLRLIHHLSTIYQDMKRVNFGGCTLWIEEIPRYNIVVPESWPMQLLMPKS